MIMPGPTNHIPVDPPPTIPASPAACSSSLVALHMAFNSLLAGQSSLAVNSGVNLALTPDTPAMFQASTARRACGR